MKADELLAVARKLEQNREWDDNDMRMALEVLHEKVANLEFEEVANDLETELSEDYYEPTELDEWMDFDPDC